MSSDSMFNNLSINFQLVKKELGDRLVVKPDFDDGILCPLCFRYFLRSDIARITQEHVPPKSLGGKVKTLTCKECNDTSGFKFDIEWTKKAKVEAFLSGSSKSKIPAQVTVDNLKTVIIDFL